MVAQQPCLRALAKLNLYHRPSSNIPTNQFHKVRMKENKKEIA
jgi:hypothetical protein